MNVLKSVCLFVALAGIPPVLYLVASPPSPPPVAQKERPPLEQPKWKPRPPKPAPDPPGPPPSGIKTYQVGEMIDLGNTRFGQATDEDARRPPKFVRPQYEAQPKFRPQQPVRRLGQKKPRMQSFSVPAGYGSYNN